MHSIVIEQRPNRLGAILAIDGQAVPHVVNAKMQWNQTIRRFQFSYTQHLDFKGTFGEETVTMSDFCLTVRDYSPQPSFSIDELQDLCHKQAHDAGWWDNFYSMAPEYRKYFQASCYALFHSEISEGLEGLRKDKKDDHLPHRKSEEVELADLIIRVMDYAGAMKFDLSGAIAEKLAYNAKRQDHTREARNAEGGKKL